VWVVGGVCLCGETDFPRGNATSPPLGTRESAPFRPRSSDLSQTCQDCSPTHRCQLSILGEDGLYEITPDVLEHQESMVPAHFYGWFKFTVGGQPEL
jgi:hypothetical protein